MALFELYLISLDQLFDLFCFPQSPHLLVYKVFFEGGAVLLIESLVLDSPGLHSQQCPQMQISHTWT